ncbi:DUF3238 domain-containing protein [Tumebacillus avium]|uniref:DUF3238 domain-containing protein n=1 Tax=Tumebacillus avium TaxID=1903704 RepID=UPI0012FDF34F|nr:DUF3238 domain-containing protein [Tumebacillus avium]
MFVDRLHSGEEKLSHIPFTVAISFKEVNEGGDGMIILRVVTFIPKNPENSDPSTDWIYLTAVPIAPGSYVQYYYLGDERDFNPYTANTQDFRTAQHFEIDFYYHTFASYKNTGISNQKTIVFPTLKVDYSQAQVSPNCLSVNWVDFQRDYCQISMKCDCADPFIDVAPAVNYDFIITVHSNGYVQVTGTHDGFPAFEIYKSFDNGATWGTVYKYDPRPIEAGLTELFPGHSITVNKWG